MDGKNMEFQLTFLRVRIDQMDSGKRGGFWL